MWWQRSFLGHGVGGRMAIAPHYISVKSLYIAIIVAEPVAQCALSMACVLQCGQHRAAVARHHPLESPPPR